MDHAEPAVDQLKKITFSSFAHPTQYKRFRDQAKAVIRANTLMVQKFQSGKDGKREAFQLFMEARLHMHVVFALFAQQFVCVLA